MTCNLDFGNTLPGKSFIGLELQLDEGMKPPKTRKIFFEMTNFQCSSDKGIL